MANPCRHPYWKMDWNGSFFGGHRWKECVVCYHHFAFKTWHTLEGKIEALKPCRYDPTQKERDDYQRLTTQD
jgi:hypothetical protein